MMVPCTPQITLPTVPTHPLNLPQFPYYNVMVKEYHHNDTSQKTIEKQQKFLEKKKAEKEREEKKAEKLRDIERKKHKKALMETRRNDHDESEEAPFQSIRRFEE
jgi:hypothetical protein